MKMSDNMDKADEKDIIIFGASGAGATFIEYAEKSGKYKILAVSDNDRAKHGDSFHGYDVISPTSINNYSFDEIIIASTYFPEIIDQLVNELGVARGKVKVPPKSTTGNKKSYRPFEDEATLKLAREVLLKVCKLLEEAGISYFVDHGTLLGIVRDGDLIPWDDDIDLSVEIGDMPAVIKLLQGHIGTMPMTDIVDWKLVANFREDDIPVKVLVYFDESDGHTYRPFPLSIEIFEFIEGQAVQELSYSDDYHYRANIYLDYQGVNYQLHLTMSLT